VSFARVGKYEKVSQMLRFSNSFVMLNKCNGDERMVCPSGSETITRVVLNSPS